MVVGGDFMYYGLIALSVLMFSSNFVFSQQYRKRMGSGFFQTFLLSFAGSVAGIISMAVISGLKFEFTLFSFVMAFFAALNGILLNYCSQRTLGMVNLSMYSIIMMLGGMLLPSVVGVVFFDEGMTLAKGLCYLLIAAALALTFKKDEQNTKTPKKAYLYYAGVFILNGMSGVISKIFNAADFERVSSAGYSLLTAMCTFCISGVLVLILYHTYKGKISLPAVCFACGGGGINRVANFLLVAALLHVHASVQYPMVTGGCMIVSTIIAFFTSAKPTKMQITSVALSFVGIVLLVTVPI